MRRRILTRSTTSKTFCCRRRWRGSYSVTVVGRSVNVNAVTAQTNNALGQYAPNIVQDYALVVSVGEGEVTNALTVTDSGIVSNPTGDQNFTVVITTNAPLVNQMVGASSPLLGTNTPAAGHQHDLGAERRADHRPDEPMAFLRGHQHRAGAGLHQRGLPHLRCQHAVAAAHGRL